MRSFTSAVLSQIPSVRDFIGGLADDLGERRNLLVLVPLGVEPYEVWSMLRAELWRRDFSFSEISLPSYPCDAHPVDVILKALQIQAASGRAPRNILDLASTESLPDVVELDGYEQISPEARHRWLQFVTEWAEVAKNRADTGRPCSTVCLIAPALILNQRIPTPAIRLSVRWWWRFPSVLEMRLLCRSESSGTSLDSLANWREHVLPTLCGSDFRLLEYLWDDINLPIDDLLYCLRQFAVERGWDASTLEDHGANNLLSAPGLAQLQDMLAPPKHHMPLWSCGALICTEEHGMELHIAALAALGRDEEVKHRLWRGQAGFLLPFIDEVRLSLCNYFTHTYGRDWPLRWIQPESVEEKAVVSKNPLACQWGHLELLLKKCANKLHTERRWLSLVSLARRIRNALAHYRPISYHDYANLLQESERTQIK